MKEKHPIDSFFKDKLANRQYPMKEEYWESASALIEANSARKRRRFLWFFLFLGLLSGSILIGYFTLQDNQATLIELADTVPQDAIEGKPQSLAPVPDMKLEDAAKLLATETAKAETVNIPQENSDKALESNKGKTLNKFTKKLPIQSEQRNKKISAGFAPFEEEKETGASLNKRVLGVDAQELKDKNTSVDRGISIEKENMHTTKRRVAADFLSEKSAYLTDLPLSQSKITVPPYLGGNRRHSLGLEFGFAIHDAMGSKVEQEQSIGMSPIAGLGYRFQLNRNLSLLSGARYTQTPSLAGDSTYLSTDFSFGATIQGIRIRPLTLHQVEVPLSLRWQAGTRSSLALGGYMRYLINVQSEVSRFENNPFESAPGPVNKAWGYKQGFQKIDLGLQLGYYYQLSEGLHLGLEAQYGFKDLRDNAFYRESNFDRNLNARLVLRYDFVRF